MERLFDLPAHPLLVHFPVVAIPVVALAGIWIAISPSARRQYGVVVVIAAVVTVVATFLAAASGDALTEALELPDDHIGDHRGLGNVLRFFVLLMGVSIAGVVALGDRTYEKRQAAVDAASNSEEDIVNEPPSTTIATMFRIGVLLFALLSIVWVIRTGHEGAKAVWEGQLRDDETSAVVDTTADTSTDTAVPTTTTEAPATTTAPETTAAEAADETTAAPETTEAPETTVAGDIDPVAIYAANCARCHGDDGIGTRGPNLTDFAADYPDPAPAITLITEGKGGMPSFGTKLSAAEIVALVDHLPTAFETS